MCVWSSNIAADKSLLSALTSRYKIWEHEFDKRREPFRQRMEFLQIHGEGKWIDLLFC